MRKVDKMHPMFKAVDRSERGVVLISVMVISIIMMVFAISVLSINVSQVTLGRRQVDRMKAEQYGKGNFWLNYNSLFNGTGAIGPQSITLDGKTYSVTVTPVGSGAGPNNTQRYDVTVSH